LALVVPVVLLGATDHLDLIKGPLGGGGSPGEFANLERAINNVKGPATALVGSVSSIGVVGGTVLIAGGNRKGIQVVGTSAGALAAVGLGQGIIA
jgi:hypothetical protein